MICSDDYVKLVEQARLGDKDSLDRLAEVVRVRLREYVCRLTLQDDLTQDIVQESILEMFRVFDKLKRAERFWPWLYGIAFNKIRNHYGKQWRRKTISLSGVSEKIAGADGRDGLADAVTLEFKQIVLKSMDQLQPQHRAVLTMRCYDQYLSRGEYGSCHRFRTADVTEGDYEWPSYWSGRAASGTSPPKVKLFAGYSDGRVESYWSDETEVMNVIRFPETSEPYPSWLGPGNFYVPLSALP